MPVDEAGRVEIAAIRTTASPAADAAERTAARAEQAGPADAGQPPDTGRVGLGRQTAAIIDRAWADGRITAQQAHVVARIVAMVAAAGMGGRRLSRADIAAEVGCTIDAAALARRAGASIGVLDVIWRRRPDGSDAAPVVRLAARLDGDADGGLGTGALVLIADCARTMGVGRWAAIAAAIGVGGTADARAVRACTGAGFPPPAKGAAKADSARDENRRPLQPQRITPVRSAFSPSSTATRHGRRGRMRFHISGSDSARTRGGGQHGRKALKPCPVGGPGCFGATYYDACSSCAPMPDGYAACPIGGPGCYGRTKYATCRACWPLVETCQITFEQGRAIDARLGALDAAGNVPAGILRRELGAGRGLAPSHVRRAVAAKRKDAARRRHRRDDAAADRAARRAWFAQSVASARAALDAGRTIDELLAVGGPYADEIVRAAVAPRMADAQWPTTMRRCP